MDRIVNRKAEETGTEPLSHEEDKVASLKQSFSLISDHNNGTLVGSTGRPSWLDMSKEEHSAVLKKWKRVALSEMSYTLLSNPFEDDPSINPVAGGISLGSEKRTRDDGVSPGGSAQKKNKQNDLADAMQAIMDGAVASMRAIAHEDRERFIQHQKEENEKNRELLRSLLGKD
ncbi:unnamed protein product [Phytophthora fragariaefolia]|uniref:Unnamed protein product n=1 Tax=Phytophthora fragariaefolia TaxID=1490495 RepID=A0A9W6XRN1_9STRA|nr:unnamed protein product [Phytophthora fragariaefolia]